MLTESQIESIQVARLEPGDVLVFKCQQVVSADVRERFMEQVELILPCDVKAVLLDGGMDVEVLRRAEVGSDALIDLAIAGIRNGGPLDQALQGLQRMGR